MCCLSFITIGANGLNCSLFFISLLILSLIFGFVGSANMDLCPKDLEPNSQCPLNQPTILPSFIFLAIVLTKDSSDVNLKCFLSLIRFNISLWKYCGPKNGFLLILFFNSLFIRYHSNLLISIFILINSFYLFSYLYSYKDWINLMFISFQIYHVNLFAIIKCFVKFHIYFKYFFKL